MSLAPQNRGFLRETFRFVAVDVETANSHASSICQIGLGLTDAGGQIQTVSFYVDPEQNFSAFNIQLHGIGPNHVSGAQNFAQVIAWLGPFLERNTLIQHSHFDKRAFGAACEKHALPPVETQWFDSVKIARRAWPELKGNGGHGLGHLKTFLNLDFKHHDAGEDARAAAQVVLHAESHTKVKYSELLGTSAKQGAKTTWHGDPNGPLYGQILFFSGRLKRSRADLSKQAAKLGITVKPILTKSTTLIVVPDPHAHRFGEPVEAAPPLQNKSLRILDETEFVTLLDFATRSPP